MRLFIAIDLPETIQRQLKPLLSTPVSGGKYLALDQIHLTLRFLGETPFDKFEKIREALRQIRAEPFSLALQGTGCFPNPVRARVLWVGLKTPLALLQLQNNIETLVQSLGFPADPRPFSPHLTLARFKDRPGPQLAGLLETSRTFCTEAWNPSAFRLYSSLLTPGGALHKVEENYPLG